MGWYSIQTHTARERGMKVQQKHALLFKALIAACIGSENFSFCYTSECWCKNAFGQIMGHETRNYSWQTHINSNNQRSVCSHATSCQKGSGVYLYIYSKMFFQRLVWLRFNISITKQGVGQRVWKYLRTRSEVGWLRGAYTQQRCPKMLWNTRWSICLNSEIFRSSRGGEGITEAGVSRPLSSPFQHRIPSHPLSLSVGGHLMQWHGSCRSSD